MNTVSSSSLSSIAHAHPVIFTCQIVCGLASLYCTIQAIYEAAMLLTHDSCNFDTLKITLCGAVVYGLAALEILPYTAVIGAITVIFLGGIFFALASVASSILRRIANI